MPTTRPRPVVAITPRCAPPARRPPAAFTLIELLLVVSIIVVLVAILLPSLAGARRLARMEICKSNMRQIAVGLTTYSADARGWLGTFSWQPNRAYSQWADLNNAASSLQAHANQAVDIVRRFLDNPSQNRVTGRYLARNFYYLVLLDGGYYADRLPEMGVVCPEDISAQIWQRNYVLNPSDPLIGTPNPDPNTSLGFRRFLPFWSTYQSVPCSWSQRTGTYALHQLSTPTPSYHLLYGQSPIVNGLQVARIDAVGFPSQKVYLFDLWDRHKHRTMMFHAYPESKQPLVFFDGSVLLRRTGDANRGWNPLQPTSPNPTQYYYTPTAGEPPTLSGGTSDPIIGYYRWTRRGLRGVDFAGGEIR